MIVLFVFWLVFLINIALITVAGLSATEEVKMTSMVDDINACSYLDPAELPSRKFVFKWLLEILVNALPLLIGNEDKLIWEADPSWMNQIC
ncbi:hypothetical protein CsSME_00045978 [Camellia sinensis var. sinensis]